MVVLLFSGSLTCLWSAVVGAVVLLILARLCHMSGPWMKYLDSSPSGLSFCRRPAGLCTCGDVRVPKEQVEM